MRVMDKLLKFSMQDMFDADKRKQHEILISNLCKLWVSMGDQDTSTWQSRRERFGQFIDCGINRIDEYQEEIIRAMKDQD